MSEASPELIVVSSNSRGRKRYDKASKRALVEACLRPGISIARQALESGVHVSLLRKWIAQYLLERERTMSDQAPAVGQAADFPDPHGEPVQQTQTRVILIATGAMERPSPIPGWTLPGVLTAGAAQIAMKSGPSIPSGRIVLAGAGPLLLLVACQLRAAGANIVALVETAPAENRARALRYLPAALKAPGPLLKGLRMMAMLRAARIPWYMEATDLAVEGEDGVRALRLRSRGRTVTIPADTVLLHHGVVPNTQLTRLVRLEHTWNDAQLAWQAVRDAWGETSAHGIRIAGDGGGIDGARAAEATGALAALGAAHALKRIDETERDRLAAAWQRHLRQQRRVRPFLDALYRPPKWIGLPADDTIVCRCEEVTAGKVREMAKLGCVGPNQAKFFSRCGMGPCQGRLCGITVTQLLADACHQSPQETGAYHVRAPIKPIPLNALAALSLQAQSITESQDASE